MRIYCDMDDILCETARSLCAMVEKTHGHKIEYEEILDFNLAESFSLNAAELKTLMDAAHAEASLLTYAPTPGAVESLKALRAAGHTVEIVTGRPATSFRGTEGWLKAHGLGDFRVIYVNKYGRLFTPDGDAPEMVPLAELMKTKYDVVIDDSPMVLPAFKDWTTSKILVFNRPWNKNFKLYPNMTRVFGWEDILSEIKAKYS